MSGIDAEWMINYFCKPKLKVGTEWVSIALYHMVLHFIIWCCIVSYGIAMYLIVSYGCITVVSYNLLR